MGDGALWRRTSEKGGSLGDAARRGTWQSSGASCGGSRMSAGGSAGERVRSNNVDFGSIRLMGGRAARGGRSAGESMGQGLRAWASSRQ